MTEEDLIQEFFFFVEQLEGVTVTFDILLDDMHKYIANLPPKDVGMALNKIEACFFRISHITQSLENILDDCYDVSFKNYSEKKTKEKNNLVILPLVEDEDIYVDINNNLSELWRSDKRKNNKIVPIDE